MHSGVDAAGQAPWPAPLDREGGLVELPRPLLEGECDPLGAAAGVEQGGQELDRTLRALDISSRVQRKSGPLGKGGDDAAGAGDGLAMSFLCVFFERKGRGRQERGRSPCSVDQWKKRKKQDFLSPLSHRAALVEHEFDGREDPERLQALPVGEQNGFDLVERPRLPQVRELPLDNRPARPLQALDRDGGDPERGRARGRDEVVGVPLIGVLKVDSRRRT